MYYMYIFSVDENSSIAASTFNNVFPTTDHLLVPIYQKIIDTAEEDTLKLANL